MQTRRDAATGSKTKSETTTSQLAKTPSRESDNYTSRAADSSGAGSLATEEILISEEESAGEETSSSIRQILKHQPYVVVERSSERGKEVLHLTDAHRSLRNLCLCGLRYHLVTHVPLTSWGNPDRTWCRNCMFGTKNSVKNKLKEQFLKGREQSTSVPTDIRPGSPPIPDKPPNIS